MATKYKLLRLAESDYIEIYIRGLNEFGALQSAQYVEKLSSTFSTLADNPTLGRRCDYIRPNLQRYEVGKHTIFYKQTKTGITVVRILRQERDFKRHI